MGDMLIMTHAVISIALVVGLIVWLQLSPVIALIVSSLYLGVATGLGWVDTVDTIANGFGDIMRDIGLVIGFGVLIGSLAAETGAIQRIAHALLRGSGGGKRAPYAMTFSGLLVSTPVFYDVGYVLLGPLARSIARQARISLGLMGAALVLGLGAAHTFIPPTPGPLAVAGTLNVPLGEMILFGIVIGVPTALTALFLYARLINRGLWNPGKDEEQEGAQLDTLDTATESTAWRPSLATSLVPILLPVVLILVGTVADTRGYDATWVQFLSHEIIALLLGVLAVLALAVRLLPRERREHAVSEGLRTSGIVLLITGAGGAFGATLEAAGVGDVLGGILRSAPVTPILLVWFIAAVLKLAQGSGTVALITAANIIAPVADTLDISPVLLAMAIASGTKFVPHVNDSGFWVSVKLLGVSTRGGFKMMTLPNAIASIVSLLLVSLLALII